jgi:ubiquinone biosynthesis monooxygenase Coq7
VVGQLRHMAAQEQAHLDAFDAMLTAGRVRPTALAPLWDAAGFALGAATALMGEKAAHACTEAVETVIEEHYADQVAELAAAGETDLAARLAGFRDDELEHRDLASAEGAREAPAYPLLSAAIRFGCRVAIRLSERV